MVMGQIGSIQERTTPYRQGFPEEYGSSIVSLISTINALKKRKWDKKLQRSLLEDASKPSSEGDFTSRLQELGDDPSIPEIMAILPEEMGTPAAVKMIQERHAGQPGLIERLSPLGRYGGGQTEVEQSIMKGYKPGTPLDRLSKRIKLAKTIQSILPKAEEPEKPEKPAKATQAEVKYTRTKARFRNAAKIAKQRGSADFITNPAQQEVTTITNQAEAKQAATLAGLDPVGDKEIRALIEALPRGRKKTGFLGLGKGRERPSPYFIDKSTGTRIESFASEEEARKAGKKTGDKIHIKGQGIGYLD